MFETTTLQQTTNHPWKRNGCGKRTTWSVFSFWSAISRPIVREFSVCFLEWFVFLSLCGLLRACALQQNKNKQMSAKARLYHQRVTNLDPFHPPNNEESYFEKHDVWVWVMIIASSFVTRTCNPHLMGKNILHQLGFMAFSSLISTRTASCHQQQYIFHSSSHFR